MGSNALERAANAAIAIALCQPACRFEEVADAETLREIAAHVFQAAAWAEELNLRTREAARVCHVAGIFACQMVSYQDAERFLALSRDIYEGWPEANAELALTLNQLGKLSASNNSLRTATGYFIAAIKCRIPVAGIQDGVIAIALSNLSDIYRRLGNDKKALATLHVAFQITPPTLGIHNVVYGFCWHTYALLGTRYELDTIVQESFGYSAKALGSVPNTLAYVAGLELRASRAETAPERDVLSQEALRIRHELFGDDHPQYASGLIHRGNLTASAGNLEDARSMLRHALQILRRRFDDKHTLIQAALQTLSNLEIHEVEAVPFVPYRGEVSEEHPLYESMLCRQEFDTLMSRRRSDEARTKLQELFQLQLDGMDEYREDYVNILLNAAQQLAEIQQMDDAEPFIWQLFAVYQKFLGDYHGLTLQALEMVLVVYRPLLVERLKNLNVEKELFNLPRWPALAFATHCARIAWDSFIALHSQNVQLGPCHELLCAMEQSHSEAKRSRQLLKIASIKELETKLMQQERAAEAELNWDLAGQWRQSSKALTVVRLVLAAMLAPTSTVTRKHISDSYEHFVQLHADFRMHSHFMMVKLLIWMNEAGTEVHAGIPFEAMERIYWPPPNLERI